MVLYIIISSKQLWFLLAALSLLKPSFQLVLAHRGQTTTPRCHRNTVLPPSSTGGACHHCHQPPTGGNVTLMVTASISPGALILLPREWYFHFLADSPLTSSQVHAHSPPPLHCPPPAGSWKHHFLSSPGVQLTKNPTAYTALYHNKPIFT